MKYHTNARKRYLCIFMYVATVLFLCGAVVGILIFNGIILLNDPSAEKYPVRGVDVSSYQGEIDWDVLSSQGISFAYIKATEGSSLTDPRFSYNLAESQKHKISVGAYHFFSYDSPGETQAKNFIETVEPFDGMLPPAIDLEFYGDYERTPPSRDLVDTELIAMLSAIEQHYGLKPIIYATERSYSLYLSGGYQEYDIWIRDVYSRPELSDGRKWTFWQYTNRAHLDGYKGKERFIDMNVFHGSKEEFDAFPRYASE